MSAQQERSGQAQQGDSEVAPTASTVVANELIGAIAGCISGIEAGDAVFVVRLQFIEVSGARVHDRDNGLPGLVGMIQAQGMAEFMEYHPMKILYVGIECPRVNRPVSRLIEGNVGLAEVPDAGYFCEGAFGHRQGVAKIQVAAGERAPAGAV